MRVPADSWQVGPHNRWAYVHVDEIVPTVPVPRGDGPAMPLPAGESDLRLDDLPELDGLAVVHRGRLVAEVYGGQMTETSLHLSQSVAKSVAGLVAGILVGRGELDPSSPVTGHVPEVAGSGYEGATVRHLLDMTAAIDFVEDYAVDFWRYDVACAWHPPVPGVAGTILEYLPSIGPAGTWSHGERFHYSTPNTDLLGIVLERVTGVPLAELISRELWGPLGAERDAALTVDHAGTAAIGGGFCATLRDYARLGWLVAAGGVVPAEWLAELGDGDAAAFARAGYPTSGADGYRNQWWRRDGVPTARGIHGQLVAADPATQTAVAILSSWPEATDAAREARQRSLVAGIVARLA